MRSERLREKPHRRSAPGTTCADPDPEDGKDPRKDYLKRPNLAPNRKALQLCSQVERTLNLILPDCGEDRLRDLLVLSVEPAPDSTRLLVTLGQTPSAVGAEPAEMLAAQHVHYDKIVPAVAVDVGKIDRR